MPLVAAPPTHPPHCLAAGWQDNAGLSEALGRISEALGEYQDRSVLAQACTLAMRRSQSWPAAVHAVARLSALNAFACPPPMRSSAGCQLTFDDEARAPAWWVRTAGDRGHRQRVWRIDAQGRAEERPLPQALVASAHLWFGFELSLPHNRIRAASSEGVSAGEPSHKALKRAIGLLSIERADAFAVLVYAGTTGLLALALPIAVQSLVNTLALGALFTPMAVLTLLFLGLASFAAVVQALELRLVERLQQRIFVRTACDLARRYVQLPGKTLRYYHGPELANRFFDVTTLQKSVAFVLLDGLEVALAGLIGMVLLASYHPWLLVFDVILIGLLLLVIFGAIRNASHSALEESRHKYAVAGWLEELMTRPGLLRHPQATVEALGRNESQLAAWLGARQRHYRSLFFQQGAGLCLQVLAAVGLMGLGSLLIYQRELSLGQLVAAELVVGAMGSAFAKLGKHLENYYDLLACLDKLGKLIDLPLERRGGEVPSGHGPVALALEGVVLAADGGRAPRALSLSIAPAQHAAIVGHAGTGKSLLCDTLTGAVETAAGRVFADDLALDVLDLTAWRGQALLLRDAEFVPGSLFDNLRLLAPDLETFQARDMLARVELGSDADQPCWIAIELEDELLVQGALLPKRAARRIALARALLARPRLLILDEALDGLGLTPAGFERLLAYILDPKAAWTAVVVTTEPQVLQACTQVINLSPHVINLPPQALEEAHP